MAFDRRPKLLTASTYAYMLLWVIGLLLFLLRTYLPVSGALVPKSSTKDMSFMEKQIGQTKWRDVIWREDRGLGDILLAGVALSLITVSSFELLKLFVQLGIYYRTTRRAIEDFWGEDSAEKSGDGQIVLQSDVMSVLLEGIVDIDRTLEHKPDNRLYKARDWVDRFDAEGAEAVADLFRKLGLNAPKLEFVARNTVRKDMRGPFRIVMGLGFTDEANIFLSETCGQWLNVIPTENGDALALKYKLLPKAVATSLKIDPPDGPPDEFRTLFPLKWDLPKWLDGVVDVRDYAIILRHTIIDNTQPRRVLFVVGGFTERGTAAGGRYLATNWEKLWREHVQGKARQGSLGDFCIIIEGSSHGNPVWEEVTGFVIKPDDLKNINIKCPWRDRLQ